MPLLGFVIPEASSGGAPGAICRGGETRADGVIPISRTCPETATSLVRRLRPLGSAAIIINIRTFIAPPVLLAPAGRPHSPVFAPTIRASRRAPSRAHLCAATFSIGSGTVYLRPAPLVCRSERPRRRRWSGRYWCRARQDY